MVNPITAAEMDKAVILDTVAYVAQSENSWACPPYIFEFVGAERPIAGSILLLEKYLEELSAEGKLNKKNCDSESELAPGYKFKFAYRAVKLNKANCDSENKFAYRAVI